jgi:hypothetical protein
LPGPSGRTELAPKPAPILGLAARTNLLVGSCLRICPPSGAGKKTSHRLVLFPATRVYVENACGGPSRIVLQSSLARSRGNKRTPSGVSPIGGLRTAGGGKEMDNNQNGGVDRLMWPFRPRRTTRSPAQTLRFTFQLVYGPRAGLAFMIICSCNFLTDRAVRTMVTTAVRPPTTPRQVYKRLGCARNAVGARAASA